MKSCLLIIATIICHGCGEGCEDYELPEADSGEINDLEIELEPQENICTHGQPCGNSCISWDKVCHKNSCATFRE